MTEKNDGGPAFPQKSFAALTHGAGNWETTGGMSLRDWFAQQAPEMPEQWWKDTKAEYGGRSGSYAEAIAAWRYFYADAMLAARKEQPK